METKIESEIAVDPAATCSAFWESVAGTAATIIKTLPQCGSSSLVNESQALRKELGRLVGIMERASMPMVKILPFGDWCSCENPGHHFHPGSRGKFCAVCGKDILPNADVLARGESATPNQSQPQ